MHGRKALSEILTLSFRLLLLPLFLLSFHFFLLPSSFPSSSWLLFFLFFFLALITPLLYDLLFCPPFRPFPSFLLDSGFLSLLPFVFISIPSLPPLQSPLFFHPFAPFLPFLFFLWVLRLFLPILSLSHFLSFFFYRLLFTFFSIFHLCLSFLRSSSSHILPFILLSFHLFLYC